MFRVPCRKNIQYGSWLSIIYYPGNKLRYISGLLGEHRISIAGWLCLLSC
uniref:Uncharacterized protein n=1 Tax=Arundo donax TaxID=35708 RepID=A0A0A9CXZ3_ARUDO